MRNLPRQEGGEGVPASGNLVNKVRAASTESGHGVQCVGVEHEKINNQHSRRVSALGELYYGAWMNYTISSSHLRDAVFLSLQMRKPRSREAK